MSYTANYWSQITDIKILPNVIGIGNKNYLKQIMYSF